MKPRFRNANLLITYVVDSCVKLLAVLYISSVQGAVSQLLSSRVPCLRCLFHANKFSKDLENGI